MSIKVWIRGCQINDTGPQLFSRQPQFCRFDVPTCSKSIMDQFTMGLKQVSKGQPIYDLQVQ